MKEDSDQKERCNKKAEGKFGFFEDCQSDTTSKKAKKRSLYKQNIFCSSKLRLCPHLLTAFTFWDILRVYSGINKISHIFVSYCSTMNYKNM